MLSQSCHGSKESCWVVTVLDTHTLQQRRLGEGYATAGPTEVDESRKRIWYAGGSEVDKVGCNAFCFFVSYGQVFVARCVFLVCPQPYLLASILMCTVQTVNALDHIMRDSCSKEPPSLRQSFLRTAGRYTALWW